MSQMLLIDDIVPVADRAAPQRQQRPMTSRLSTGVVPYLFLLPAAVTLFVWVYRPLAETIQLSFYRWNMLPTSEKEWVGWDNYRDMLELPELGQSIGVTVWMMIGLIPFTIILPVIMSILTQRLGSGSRDAYRGAIFLPVLITPVVTAAVWRWLLSTNGGVYQQPLEWVGLDPINWFRKENSALIAVILIAGWKMLGFATLMVTAGLSNVDPAYVEAAAVDGAKPGRILRRITLPLLSPTLTFMALMTVLLTAQWLFPLIELLTTGGPSGATTNIYYLLYKMGFTSFDVGLSSAAGVMFFGVFTVIALVCLRLMDRWSFYEGQS